MGMIIYSVTVNVEPDIHDDWKDWMVSKHIPDVMATGFFVEHRMSRVLTTQEDETGHTYNIQYTCESMETLENYQEQHAPALQQEHTSRYEGKFVAFRTLLELV